MKYQTTAVKGAIYYRHWTTKEGFGGTDLFVDFASVECHSIRNDRCLFSEVRHHKQFGWIRR